MGAGRQRGSRSGVWSQVYGKMYNYSYITEYYIDMERPPPSPRRCIHDHRRTARKPIYTGPQHVDDEYARCKSMHVLGICVCFLLFPCARWSTIGSTDDGARSAALTSLFSAALPRMSAPPLAWPDFFAKMKGLPAGGHASQVTGHCSLMIVPCWLWSQALRSS